MIINRLSQWPGWETRSPISELERMRREMERLTEGLNRGLFRERTAGVFPLVNLTEDPDRFYLRAELPGVKASDLDISVTGNSVTISGERKIPEEGEGVTYHRREREAGRFSRTVSIPDPVDTTKIEAECKNGVLTITLPRAEESKPRQIAVKSS